MPSTGLGAGDATVNETLWGAQANEASDTMWEITNALTTQSRNISTSPVIVIIACYWNYLF